MRCPLLDSIALCKFQMAPSRVSSHRSVHVTCIQPHRLSFSAKSCSHWTNSTICGRSDHDFFNFNQRPTTNANRQDGELPPILPHSHLFLSIEDLSKLSRISLEGLYVGGKLSDAVGATTDIEGHEGLATPWIGAAETIQNLNANGFLCRSVTPQLRYTQPSPLVRVERTCVSPSRTPERLPRL